MLRLRAKLVLQRNTGVGAYILLYQLRSSTLEVGAIGGFVLWAFIISGVVACC